MKNVNYNLLKLLHSALDNEWRIDKHYINDAKGVCKNCEKLLGEMKSDLVKQIANLKSELGMHTQGGKGELE